MYNSITESIVPQIVSNLISEDIDSIIESKEYSASVAIVKHRDKWLLGLAKCSDNRNNKWVFPGGGIKSNESPEEAAVREAKEETGITCKAVSNVIKDKEKKHVAFVACKASSYGRIDHNHEFAHVGWFTEKEMKSLELYSNVKRLIIKAKKFL